MARSSRDDSAVKIEQLLEQFYGSARVFPAGLNSAASTEVPAPYDTLLDHHAHMTVTVESHYGEPVDVVVHRTKRQGNWYSREITLQDANDQKRSSSTVSCAECRCPGARCLAAIESQQIPLGRVLIEHNVLREVQLCELWRVEAGPNLANSLGI